MYTVVTQFFRNCYAYKRAKTSKDKYYGLLNPLQLADRPQYYISIDFITKLPTTGRGYNCIVVIVCRLTKRRILEAIIKGDKGTSTEETVKLVYLSIRR